MFSGVVACRCFRVGTRIISSSEVLEGIGYDYLVVEEGASSPELADTTFQDIIPEFVRGSGRVRELVSKKLYLHQLRTLKVLEEGKNVILVSGTGSGKTEAWATYAVRGRLKVLAIYPTLALSQDRIDRLRNYYSAVGLPEGVVEVDRPKVSMKGVMLGLRGSY